MTDNVIHLDVQMTGNRREDAQRRAEAIEYAAKAAAQDPLVALRMALGRAYSAAHIGTARSHIINQLRELISEPQVHRAALGYQTRLREVVAARTRGDKCGDYIGQFQLELLDEVLIPTEGPDNAA